MNTWLSLTEVCRMPWASSVTSILIGNDDRFYALFGLLHLEVIATKATQLIPCTSSGVIDLGLPSLLEFVRHVVHVTQSLPVTLFSAIILLDKLKNRLPSKASGTAETCHRVFLASIIIANKLLFDVPMKNLTWSESISSFYSLSEINLMERQFLSFIGFNIHLSEGLLWKVAFLILNRPQKTHQAILKAADMKALPLKQHYKGMYRLEETEEEKSLTYQHRHTHHLSHEQMENGNGWTQIPDHYCGSLSQSSPLYRECYETTSASSDYLTLCEKSNYNPQHRSSERPILDSSNINSYCHTVSVNNNPFLYHHQPIPYTQQPYMTQRHSYSYDGQIVPTLDSNILSSYPSYNEALHYQQKSFMMNSLSNVGSLIYVQDSSLFA